MDFMHLVRSKQVEQGLTDKEVGLMAGIEEYTYYNLVKYRGYLSRVAYYALSCVFKLPILSEDEIVELLKENKDLVGTPETNLYVADNFIDIARVDLLEKELARLKETHKSVEKKNEVINKQYKEIEELHKEIEKLRKDINDKVQQAYIDGIKEGSSKISNMQRAHNNALIEALNLEYTEKIDKLELALKRADLRYSRLYKTVIDNNLVNNIDTFDKPMILSKEEMGMTLNDTLISDILIKYYEENISVESISDLLGIFVNEVEDIIVNYQIVDKNGVKMYVKKK